MVGWDNLPKIFKKDVAKKLDVMSRHAMRCTSRQERSIVDSTKFYIPRVRLTIKDENKCMVMIYTGIEKFLRMEFLEGTTDETIIHRMENSYDLKDATIKVIPSSVPIQIAFSILKTLFIHRTVLLGALELELSDPVETDPRSISRQMLEIIGDLEKIENLFRTKKLVINSMKILTDDVPISLMFCNPEICEDVEHNLLEFFDSYMLPRNIYEKNEIKGDGLYLYSYHDTLLSMRDGLFLAPKKLFKDAMETCGYATCRYKQGNIGEIIWNTPKIPITKLNDKVQLKRIENMKEGFVLRVNMSECGFWIHMMKIEKEEKYMDFFKQETCGLRWMCKNCSDPFEYWFYQTLPRRLHYEPKWIDIIDGYEVPDVNEEMLEEMKRMKEYQIKMKKSWGFRKMENNADSDDDSADPF